MGRERRKGRVGTLVLAALLALVAIVPAIARARRAEPRRERAQPARGPALVGPEHAVEPHLEGLPLARQPRPQGRRGQGAAPRRDAAVQVVRDVGAAGRLQAARHVRAGRRPGAAACDLRRRPRLRGRQDGRRPRPERQVPPLDRSGRRRHRLQRGRDRLRAGLARTDRLPRPGLSQQAAAHARAMASRSSRGCPTRRSTSRPARPTGRASPRWRRS